MSNKKELNDKKDVAWMLQYSGELIPVSRGMHIYGILSDNTDDETLEENVAVASFLYKYGGYSEAQKTMEVYVARVLYGSAVDIENMTEIEFYKIFNRKEQGYRSHWLKWSQVEYESGSVDLFRVWKNMRIKTNEKLESFYEENLNYNSNVVNHILNTNFARVRFGIKVDNWYDTYEGENNLIFRVSSMHGTWLSGADWAGQIYGAVLKIREMHPNLATVTIVRDPESTGEQNRVYQNEDGKNIWFMNIDEFLSKPLILCLGDADE